MFVLHYEYNLKNLNTFGFKCIAKCMLIIEDIAEITNVFNELRTKHNIDINYFYKQNKLLILGGGSNILFAHNYYDGLVIHIKDENINIYAENKICVSAGYNWHDFVKWCLKNNFYGLENLALIPGKVGACPIQNIGAYGVEAEQYIEQVEVFNLENNTIEIIYHQNCNFEYRNSIFKQSKKYIILKVYFEFYKNGKNYIPNIIYKELQNYLDNHQLDISPQNIFNAVIEIRQNKLPDPKILGNAGSFLKNPIIDNELLKKLKENYPDIVNFPIDNKHTKISAGWLIDKAGWKGYIDEINKIGVYSKQALVLVNYNQENGNVLLELAKKIQNSVKQKFEIELEIEVNLIE